MEDRVRVLRLVEFVGPRSWVEQQVARSLHGTRIVKDGCEIRCATVGDYPEILTAGPVTTGFTAEEYAGNVGRKA
jgi:hypothetical protein